MYSLFSEGSSVSAETWTHIEGFEVAFMVRRIHREEHCAALAQLAWRISESGSLVLGLARILLRR